MQHSFVSIRNLYKIFGWNPDGLIDKAKAGLSKSEMLEHHGHVLGLRDINIEIRKGDVTVIMGLSGSGKSTLIRHLNRLIDPTAGEVIINGTDVMSLTDQELRSLRQTQMSMVFQKFALFPHQTVLKNTGMPLSVRHDDPIIIENEARKWLERVGLRGSEELYPHQLSGGMQQRVGLARALTSNSELMLMDEAFSALDPLIRTSMQDLLLELQEDLHKTIVFITHDLDEAMKLADHLVILKDGQVVQQGDPQGILLAPADPYIEDFVRDINRARVLRVRSVMLPVSNAPVSDEVDANKNLEELITLAGGDVSLSYRVTSNMKEVGFIDMKTVMHALVSKKGRGSPGASTPGPKTSEQ